MFLLFFFFSSFSLHAVDRAEWPRFPETDAFMENTQNIPPSIRPYAALLDWPFDEGVNIYPHAKNDAQKQENLDYKKRQRKKSFEIFQATLPLGVNSVFYSYVARLCRPPSTENMLKYILAVQRKEIPYVHEDVRLLAEVLINIHILTSTVDTESLILCDEMQKYIFNICRKKRHQNILDANADDCYDHLLIKNKSSSQQKKEEKLKKSSKSPSFWDRLSFCCGNRQKNLKD